MKVLGIETSCDECAAAVVEDGRNVLSNVVATQIPFHAAYNGVVPEIASRMHTEWIYGVVEEAVRQAGLKPDRIDGVGVTSRPGLLGSLLVGLSFAKAFAWARNIPFITADHLLAHLYASRLADTAGAACPPPAYPFLGLLVSGGHTMMCRADDFDRITVLGTTIDDAVGEAFDKVSCYYGMGYPGGAAIDRLSQEGDPEAFRFPLPKIKGGHRYDFSYSGLKTAAVNQLDLFRVRGRGEPDTKDAIKDIAASFQKAAVDILLRSLFRAVEDTGLTTVVSGGGAAANSYLRGRLAAVPGLRSIFPPLGFCGDNGAMIAGISYHYLLRGDRSPLAAGASPNAGRRRAPSGGL